MESVEVEHRVVHTEAELVAELREGGSFALGELFDRHADRVYNHCFRRTGSWDLAEDATSAVFLELWRARERARLHDDSALPWILGIATNVCHNLNRKRRRHLRAVSRIPRYDIVPDHSDAVAGRLDDERRMAGLLEALDELPKRDRELIALVAWSGLSYEQAAASLEIPVGTVRSRLSRARRRLAAAMTPQIGKE